MWCNSLFFHFTDVSLTGLNQTSAFLLLFFFFFVMRSGQAITRLSLSPASAYENEYNLDFETIGIWSQRADKRKWRTKLAQKKERKKNCSGEPRASFKSWSLYSFPLSLKKKILLERKKKMQKLCSGTLSSKVSTIYLQRNLFLGKWLIVRNGPLQISCQKSLIHNK